MIEKMEIQNFKILEKLRNDAVKFNDRDTYMEILRQESELNEKSENKKFKNTFIKVDSVKIPNLTINEYYKIEIKFPKNFFPMYLKEILEYNDDKESILKIKYVFVGVRKKQENPLEFYIISFFKADFNLWTSEVFDIINKNIFDYRYVYDLRKVEEKRQKEKQKESNKINKILEMVKKDLKANFPNVKYREKRMNDYYNTIYFIIDKETFIQERFKKWRFKIQRKLIWQIENLHIGFDYE